MDGVDLIHLLKRSLFEGSTRTPPPPLYPFLPPIANSATPSFSTGMPFSFSAFAFSSLVCDSTLSLSVFGHMSLAPFLPFRFCARAHTHTECFLPPLSENLCMTDERSPRTIFMPPRGTFFPVLGLSFVHSHGTFILVLLMCANAATLIQKCTLMLFSSMSLVHICSHPPSSMHVCDYIKSLHDHESYL